MTHVTEYELGDHVEEYLIGAYGEQNVDREPTLEDGPAEGYRPDFLVTGRLCRWAFELENDAPSVRDAVGQAIEYAQNAPDLRPVIVVPKDHIDADRFESFHPYLLIREFDVDAGELV